MDKPTINLPPSKGTDRKLSSKVVLVEEWGENPTRKFVIIN